MAEQLSLDFTASATQRHRRALRLAELDDQPTLFASWSPNIDIHLQSTTEAIAQISGADPERAHHWLAGVMGGGVRVIKSRRVAIPADRLDRLLHVRPPAQVTLDAAATAVGRALWAHKLGLRPLNVRRDRRRLFADSPRWPAGMRVKDAPWHAIATLISLGLKLNVDPDAQPLLRRKLEDSGTTIAVAGMAGSAVVIETSRPEIVENLHLPALAYVGERNSGNYKLPLLAAAPLLQQKVIDVPDQLRASIEKATAPIRPLRPRDLGSAFPWSLYDFQAEDAGRAVRILETTGGVLLAGDMGSGKAVADTTPLLTPTGVARADTLAVGDLLVGLDGRPTRIEGVYPQGRRDLWRVSTSDGACIDVDDEHLWTVLDRAGHEHTLTTADLRAQPLTRDDGTRRWHLPLCAPYEPATPLAPRHDPWLCGNVIAAASDPEHRGLVPAPLLTQAGSDPRWLAIPDEARQWTPADRHALLQGLLDRAAHPRPGGAHPVRLRTRSAALAGGVIWLVRSLGGVAVAMQRGNTHLVDLTLPAALAPFRRPGKAAAVQQLAATPARALTGITRVTAGDARCFHVSAPDHLFLDAQFLPVHNTTIGLALAQHLDIWPLLVVSPLAAFSTWERQLGEMGRSFYLATDSPKKAWAEIEIGTHEAVVISYDRLPAFVELIDRMHFRGIIADEIQRIRTPGSKRSRALRALASSVPLRIGLSGTPLTNTVADVLPLGAFLAPGEWRPRAAEKDLEDMYPGDPTESLAEHLGCLMVRRRIDQVGKEMPVRNDHRIHVELTPEQRAALAALEAEAQAAKEAGDFDGPNGKFNALVKLSKMRGILANPRAAGVAGPNPKVQAAVRLIKDFHSQGRKGVIFTVDRASFSDLGAELDREGIRWGGIWGSTPPLERIAVEKRLHAGELDVVICTIAAGAESWTASPTATYCMFLSYVWAPSSLAQAEARVYRLNADLNGPPIEIVYLHAHMPGGSLDDRMVEVLDLKRVLFAQVVDRTDYEDATQVHLGLSDVLYVLTGQRDEALAAAEKDAAAATEREQERKAHAQRTLYRHKGRNKARDLDLDDGSQATTLQDHLDAELEDLMASADHDEDLA